MLSRLEDKVLVLARRRPPGLFFYRRNFMFRNVGDELSPVIVSAILRQKYAGIGWRVGADKRKMLAIGSILHFALDGDVVWGAGVNGKIPRSSHRFSDLDVRSVRGPRTREFLMELGVECPCVFGDPALLAPKFLKRFNPYPDTCDFIFIPHCNDTTDYHEIKNLVSPIQNYKLVIRKILSAKKVISSSLHGIILAEAYGVPAVLIYPCCDETEFKYLDYYEGTMRYNIEIAENFDEAIRMKGSRLPKEFSLQKVENSFPHDFYC